MFDEGAVVCFDPQSIPDENEYTFEAQASINEYLEKHFKCKNNWSVMQQFLRSQQLQNCLRSLSLLKTVSTCFRGWVTIESSISIN